MLLAYQQPIVVRYETASSILCTTAISKIATSRNYHHFFPRNYLELNQKDKEPNWIAISP